MRWEMTNLWNVHAYDPLNAKNCDIIQVFQFCLWTLSEIKYYIYVQIHPDTHTRLIASTTTNLQRP